MEQFIKNLARGAGAILKEGFHKELQINHKKGYWDVVTQYDLAADKYIQDRIKKKFPKHSILSEETGGSRKGQNIWVIDPLDGTRNFSRGTPLFCTIIAFIKNGKTELGAIYDPIKDELFYAQRGKGAALNGKAIDILKPDTLAHSMAGFDWHVIDTTARIRHKINNLIYNERLWYMALGSAGLDLGYLAAGRFDFGLLNGAHPWDYAAGILIAREAGAKVTDFRGHFAVWDSKQVVAASPKLHKQIMQYLK